MITVSELIYLLADFFFFYHPSQLEFSTSVSKNQQNSQQNLPSFFVFPHSQSHSTPHPLVTPPPPPPPCHPAASSHYHPAAVPAAQLECFWHSSQGRKQRCKCGSPQMEQLYEQELSKVHLRGLVIPSGSGFKRLLHPPTPFRELWCCREH